MRHLVRRIENFEVGSKEVDSFVLHVHTIGETVVCFQLR